MQSTACHAEHGLPCRARPAMQSTAFHAEHGLPCRARPAMQSTAFHAEHGLPTRPRPSLGPPRRGHGRLQSPFLRLTARADQRPSLSPCPCRAPPEPRRGSPSGSQRGGPRARRASAHRPSFRRVRCARRECSVGGLQEHPVGLGPKHRLARSRCPQRQSFDLYPAGRSRRPGPGGRARRHTLGTRLAWGWPAGGAARATPPSRSQRVEGGGCDCSGPSRDASRARRPVPAAVKAQSVARGHPARLPLAREALAGPVGPSGRAGRAIRAVRAGRAGSAGSAGRAGRALQAGRACWPGGPSGPGGSQC
jgi:hypothetical protein